MSSAESALVEPAAAAGRRGRPLRSRPDPDPAEGAGCELPRRLIGGAKCQTQVSKADVGCDMLRFVLPLESRGELATQLADLLGPAEALRRGFYFYDNGQRYG